MGARPDTRSGSALAILAFWCHIFFAYNSRALRDHGWLWGTSWNFPWRQASYHARLLPKSFNTAVEAWCYQEKRQWTLCPSTEDAFWCTAIWAAFAGLWRPWDWSDPWRWRTSGAERDRFGSGERPKSRTKLLSLAWHLPQHWPVDASLEGSSLVPEGAHPVPKLDFICLSPFGGSRWSCADLIGNLWTL